MDSKPKILIGLPTMAHIHVWLGIWIMSNLVEGNKHHKWELAVYPTICVQPVDNARNEIVEEFIRGDYTHLLFVDADTIPPLDAIDKLLAVDKDIVTGVTPIVECNLETGDFYRKWNCVGMDDKFVELNTGIVQVKGAGSSCIMIKKSVFEKMEKPWYRFVYNDDHGKDVVVSEDIQFILKALGKGIETWCDTSIVCKHYKPALF